jgi:prevent-host-death family protein
MAKKTYSLYETKAKLSQIIHEVRTTGQPATVTYRGQPVVEIRALEGQPGRKSLEERVQDLMRRGVVLPARGTRAHLRPIARRPGALKRFLEERD